MKFTKEFLQAAEGSIFSGNLNEFLDLDISIDTRTLKPNQIFLALTGNNIDGHCFLLEALQSGASALIIQEDKKYLLEKISNDLLSEKFVIVVPNTLTALIKMAKKARQKFKGDVVGITGSVGKTTTKEMLKAILSKTKIPFYASYGNQNSDIGLSLNLLKLKEGDQIAVFEMGINEVGEMAELVDIAKPNISAITSIAPVHTEGLGNIDAIYKEKSLVFSYANSGVIPTEYKCCLNKNLLSFGEDGDVFALNVKSNKDHVSFDLKIYEQTKSVLLKVENPIFVNNALVAAALAHILKISFETMINGLESFLPIDGRFKRKKMRGDWGYLIDDSYNASPMSMKLSLDAFENLFALSGPKIAVVGDMLELGESTDFWHKDLINFLKSKKIDRIIFVGKYFKKARKDDSFIIPTCHVDDWEGARVILEQEIKRDSFVLLKASNSIGLKNIISFFT